MRAVFVAALFGVATVGCGATDTTPRPTTSEVARADVSAVQQAALTELFLVRERASALLLWHDAAHTGPILDSLGLATVADVSVPAELAASRVSLAELEALFARHPDGWAALYAAYPGTPGLVEVGPVTVDSDAGAAQIIVARSCGENCRMAWQVTLAQERDRAWRVRDIGPVPQR